MKIVNHTPITNGNVPFKGQLKQNISETVNALLKPKQVPEQIESNLLVKKKNRKLRI